ncbi:MAG: hypothetical protein PVG14_04720 [Anaerolineales bacterium]|jgi:hypothetical protein
MSHRLRFALLALGLLFVCFSLAALAYAFWPLEGLRDQATLAPTLFAPP